MRLRAVTELAVRVLAPEEVEIVSGIRNLDALATDEKDYPLLRHAASGTASALLREEFALDEALHIAETLYARATAEVSGVSGGEGRALVEGNVLLEVFHAGSDPDAPLIVTEHNFPFEHTVELQGETATICARMSRFRMLWHLPWTRRWQPRAADGDGAGYRGRIVHAADAACAAGMPIRFPGNA